MRILSHEIEVLSWFFVSLKSRSNCLKVIICKSFIVDFYDSFDSGSDAITSPSLEKRENLPLNQLLPCTYYITQIDPPLHGDRTIKGAVPITFASKKFEKSKKLFFQKIKKINFENKKRNFSNQRRMNIVTMIMSGLAILASAVHTKYDLSADYPGYYMPPIDTSTPLTNQQIEKYTSKLRKRLKMCQPAICNKCMKILLTNQRSRRQRACFTLLNLKQCCPVRKNFLASGPWWKFLIGRYGKWTWKTWTWGTD